VKPLNEQMTSALNLSLMNKTSNKFTTAARQECTATYCTHLDTLNAMPISESAKDLAKKTLVDSYIAEMGELIEKGL
jgi:hypothetical protein